MFDEKMKRNTIEIYLLPVILIILLLLPHLLSLNNDYIVYEPLMVQSASEIAEHGFNADLSEYFMHISNPVSTLLVLATSYKLFGESPLVSRLTMILLPFLFSIFLYFYLRKKEGASWAFLTVFLILVNPLFITFTKYIWSDVPFMVFTSIALLLLFYGRSFKEYLLSSIILAISFATKYLAVFLFPVVLAFSFLKSRALSQPLKQRLVPIMKFNLWYFAITLLLSMPVILIAFHFPAGILSPNIESIFALNFGMDIPRLFAYLMWLGLFIGPFGLIFVYDLWKRIGNAKFFIILTGLVALTLLVTHFFPIPSLHITEHLFGEMNLLGADAYVPEPYLSMILFFMILFGEILVTSITLEFINGKDEKISYLFFWILVPILLLSLVRGANRYMLIILVPLSLYITFVTKRIYSERTKSYILAALVLHAIIFLSLGFVAIY
ncbi:ArnT family glycosyltransferase [Chloroflexota bacterium]